MTNLPEVRIGVVAVGRDCFPDSLSKKRLVALIGEAENLSLPVAAMDTLVT